VKAIHVDIGDTVARDQLLAELDIPEMQGEVEAAAARLAEARALEAKAAADLELQRVIAKRSRGLREREAITEQDLEEAEAKHHMAAASLQLARAQVQSAEAELVRLGALMDYARIKAPFDGVVTERFVDTGALLQAATTSANVSPIVTVARVDRVRVFADVPEPEVPFVDTEDRATFVPNGPRGVPLEGRVTRFAEALNPATRTMRVEVDFANPERRLLPGMYGTLSLAHHTERDTVTLPAAAVLKEKGGASYVYVVVGGKAVRRNVQTGIDDGIRVQIVEGLDGGETCIVAAPGGISDGSPVRPIETAAAAAKTS
jgi:RND family efflux transporter MFP subunit